jgi:hypothetical protein
MKKTILLQTIIICCISGLRAQFKIDCDPSVQQGDMQYFSPAGKSISKII